MLHPKPRFMPYQTASGVKSLLKSFDHLYPLLQFCIAGIYISNIISLSHLVICANDMDSTIPTEMLVIGNLLSLM